MALASSGAIQKLCCCRTSGLVSGHASPTALQRFDPIN